MSKILNINGEVYADANKRIISTASINVTDTTAPSASVSVNGGQLIFNIGMPKAQQADICVLSILAMAEIKPDDDWESATNNWIRIHDIIAFANQNYGTSYAENSRETFRKQAMHRFRTAALIEDNGKATNSPNYRYRITDEALKVLCSIGTSNEDNELNQFLSNHDKLVDIYSSKKKMTMMPVKINGVNLQFSTSKHNELQKAIIEEFAPRFAPNSECLYVGGHNREGSG